MTTAQLTLRGVTQRYDERTVLFDDAGVDHEMPALSSDGRTIAWVRTVRSTPAGASQQEVWTADIDGSGARRIATDWDRWPSQLVFEHGDRALLATADQDGRAPVFRERIRPRQTAR